MAKCKRSPRRPQPCHNTRSQPFRHDPRSAGTRRGSMGRLLWHGSCDWVRSLSKPVITARVQENSRSGRLGGPKLDAPAAHAAKPGPNGSQDPTSGWKHPHGPTCGHVGELRGRHSPGAWSRGRMSPQPNSAYAAFRSYHFRAPPSDSRSRRSAMLRVSRGSASSPVSTCLGVQ